MCEITAWCHVRAQATAAAGLLMQALRDATGPSLGDAFALVSG